MSGWLLAQADARRLPLADRCVQCVVTSPPYWGSLRDYGCDGQLGIERHPRDYIASLRSVFAELRRVIRPDGVAWLNLRDTYAASGKGGGGIAGKRGSWDTVKHRRGYRQPPRGYKYKDLALVSFAAAEAIRQDGWTLRATIVWRKPTATEPMRVDRPSLSHEYLFQFGATRHSSVTNPGEAWWGHSVWDITPASDAAHPAAMPGELARRCVACSSNRGDLILDPFNGSGTTGDVARQLDRRYVGFDLSRDYLGLAVDRIGSALTPRSKLDAGPAIVPLAGQLSLFAEDKAS